MPAFAHIEAPATKMVAIACACCGTPLVDARSLAVGMGPHCRSKHGYNAAMKGLEETARVVANKIIYEIAAAQEGPMVIEQLNALRKLAPELETVSDRIAKRIATVKISVRGDGAYLVQAPYLEEMVPAWRGVPGRRWDKDSKANVVPASSRVQLWAVLKQFFGGKHLWSTSQGRMVTL